jgi:hypothetical protein
VYVEVRPLRRVSERTVNWVELNLFVGVVMALL